MRITSGAGSASSERLVSLRGPLDKWGAAKLRLRTLLPFARGCRKLILDLRRVPYIDSDGVRALQSIISDIGEGQIEIRHANSRVQRALTLLRLTDAVVIR